MIINDQPFKVYNLKPSQYVCQAIKFDRDIETSMPSSFIHRGYPARPLKQKNRQPVAKFSKKLFLASFTVIIHSRARKRRKTHLRTSVARVC